MSNKPSTRVQAILPDAIVEKFNALAKKHNRSRSNLAKKYIVEGIMREEGRDPNTGELV